VQQGAESFGFPNALRRGPLCRIGEGKGGVGDKIGVKIGVLILYRSIDLIDKTFYSYFILYVQYNINLC
jgi:hypothetical protein